MTHTPGYWKHTLKDGWDIVKSESGIEICNLIYNCPDNAVLIAAAPEMLEALEEVKSFGSKIPKEFHDIAKQAIKKARAT